MMEFQKTLAGLVIAACFTSIIRASHEDWHFRGQNIALGKIASQKPGSYIDGGSSTEGYTANLAVDGNEISDFTKGSCSHTDGTVFRNHNRNIAQWMVDLDGEFNVTGIIIVNRIQARIRLKNFFVVGYNEQLCPAYDGYWCEVYNDMANEDYDKDKIWITVDHIRLFKKIAINLPALLHGKTYLTLCEVKIFAAPLPSCLSIEIRNGNTVILNDSGVIADGRFTTGTTIQVNCNQNYLMKGSNSLTCLSNGAFNVSSPSCIASCSYPSLQNGSLIPRLSQYEIHSKVSVVCDNNFESVNLTVTCENAGQWSSKPYCNIIQCHHPGNPVHGKYFIKRIGLSDGIFQPSQLLPVGSNILVFCNLGYENNQSIVRQCQNDKSWSNQPSACMIKQCQYPNAIINGQFRFINKTTYNYGSADYNTSIQVTCNKGYDLNGDKKHTCNEMKAWTGQTSCEIAKCDFPDIPQFTLSIMRETNGTTEQYHSGQSRYLDKIHVTCLKGYVYRTSSSKSRQCLETKLWSGEKGQCVLVTCTELEDLKGGEYNYTNISSSEGYPYLTVATAYCHEPSRLLNPNKRSRKCNENGEWDSIPSICIRTKEAAVKITNASIIGGVSAAVTGIIIMSMVVAVFLFRRRQIKDNKTGKARRFTYLWKRETNDKRVSKSQDGIYSEIQETNLNAETESVSSNNITSSDGMYSNIIKETPCKNTLKRSNKRFDTVQSEPYYSFTNIDNIPKTAILVKDLSNLVLTGSDTKRRFETEFKRLPQGLIQPHTEALKKTNIIKNRYRNLYAYDDTRVVLKSDESSQSDYINACYVHGFKTFKQYIASQGPTKEILSDFWRMIWQEKSSMIVMLTNLIEEGKVKCEQYWPEEGTSHVFGSIIVRAEKVDNFSQFIKRTFQVKKEDSKQKPRSVTQYHFTAWPDKGVPKFASSLVQFTHKVKNDSIVQNGPIIVHCSAGVGRTGTFIALDFLTEQGKTMGYVDVFGTISAFRSQRVCLVQTLDQYIFVHHALIESLMLPTSALPAYKFPEAYQELLQMDTEKKKPKINIEFETLTKVSPVADEGDYVSSKLVRNRRKNRYSNVLPVEEFMPSLMSTYSDHENRYINAVFLSSYKERKAFIITQTPLENTREDFWDLIWEHDVHTIVMMNNLKETVESERYWPENNASVTFGNIEITAGGIGKQKHHQLISLSIRKHKMTRKIKQIRCGGWSYNHSLPDSPEVILTLLEIVKVWQRQSGHHTIVVHCMNGVDKSGLYCVISAVIERLQIEQDVAISQVIEEMRNAREQIIPSVEQYKFCHETVLAFIHQFDTYSNFTE